MSDLSIQSPIKSPEVSLAEIHSPVQASLRTACQALADKTNLGRFEIAVQNRVKVGIKDDNDLRLADELLVHVAKGGDAFQALCAPARDAAHKLHKAIVNEEQTWIKYDAKTKRWSGRWGVLREALATLILKYKKTQRELAERQQAELEAAAEAERKRKQEEARAALRNGDISSAKAIMQEAQAVVTPITSTAAPKLDNSSERQFWEVEVTDPQALAAAIGSGVISIEAIKEWNLTFFKREASARGGLPAEWPGVIAKPKEALSVYRR